jgi:hypothetical protein
MIEVRRPPESPAADAVVDALKELVVAHREVEDSSLDGPVIAEGDVVLTDPAAIAAYLEQLRSDMAAWNAFQSDACFIGDDGRIC